MRTATATLEPDVGPAPLDPAAALPAALEHGRRLGPYELLVPIASGGMGHVWAAARHGEFGFRRKVAVKVMREELAQNGAFRRMFLDEARLAANITHSNVVEVLDLGVADGVLYQAMALVDGASLADLVKLHAARTHSVVPPELVARIALDVLRGLHAAHELHGPNGAALGIVHRDMSPQNVLVGLDGVAKITDFGIAKAAGSIETLSANAAQGKLRYMAPEQIARGEVDRRADVFAMGVMLLELLSGNKPASPGSELLAGRAISFDTALPSTFAAITMRALERRPEQRFPTAEAMADAIEQAAHASGLVLSSKAVADWAAPLVSERIARRNMDADAQLTMLLSVTSPAPSPSRVEARPAPAPARTSTSSPRPAHAVTRWKVGAGVSVVVLAALALGTTVRVRSRTDRTDTESIAPSATPVVATSAPAASPSATTQSEIPTSAPSATVIRPPASSPTPGNGTRKPPHSSPHRQPSTHAAPLTTSSAPAAGPKHDNPYGR